MGASVAAYYEPQPTPPITDEVGGYICPARGPVVVRGRIARALIAAEKLAIS